MNDAKVTRDSTVVSGPVTPQCENDKVTRAMPYATEGDKIVWRSRPHMWVATSSNVHWFYLINRSREELTQSFNHQREVIKLIPVSADHGVFLGDVTMGGMRQ